MTISPDLAARIVRLHAAERWRVGTIARQLGVHRDTVHRVLRLHGAAAAIATPSPRPQAPQQPSPPQQPPLRPSRIDPYRAFMLQTLAQYPTLPASRLHAMVCERGYHGSTSHFRHLVSALRPRPAAEAYLRLRTLPGEQAQVDWAHFGHLHIGRAKRALMAFVMVLSYSRRIFLRFFLDARTDSFLQGHVEAFCAFSGSARVLLYDNLKSAVLERVGDAIRFNPTLLAFAAHHHFEPRPVAVARGNEKGRVERSIRYIRDNFFAARRFTDLADLNAQARLWCEGPACDRPWPEDPTQTVRQAFQAEQPRLLALPAAPWPVGMRMAVAVGKTPYVRFDLNDYSVPHTHVQRNLAVVADECWVRVFDGARELARHARSFDRGAQIEDPSHLQALVDRKRGARAHRACDRLAQAVPATAELLHMAAERGHPLGSITTALLRLLDQHGAGLLEPAVLDAIARQVPHPNAVRMALERAARQAGTPPTVPLTLPEHIARRDAPVRTHSLASYDRHGQPHHEPAAPAKDSP